MQMLDQGEQDDKIIGVHADDPGRFFLLVLPKTLLFMGVQVLLSFSNLHHRVP